MKRRTRTGPGQLHLVPEPAETRVGELLSRARAEIVQAQRVGRRPPARALEAQAEALAILTALGPSTPTTEQQREAA